MASYICPACRRQVHESTEHVCPAVWGNPTPDPSLDAAHLAPILKSILIQVQRIADEVCEDDEREDGWLVLALSRALDNQNAHTASLARIEAAVTVTPPGPRSLGGFVAAIHGKGCSEMASIPVPKLLDTEKILLSVMPRKADGHVDAQASVTWTATGDVGVEPGTEPFDFTDPQFNEVVTCPGSFNCFALTPGASGTGSVTASAAGYESAEFGPIEYAPGVARSLNASVGAPVSDL